MLMCVQGLMSVLVHGSHSAAQQRRMPLSSCKRHSRCSSADLALVICLVACLAITRLLVTVQAELSRLGSHLAHLRCGLGSVCSWHWQHPPSPSPQRLYIDDKWCIQAVRHCTEQQTTAQLQQWITSVTNDAACDAAQQRLPTAFVYADGIHGSNLAVMQQSLQTEVRAQGGRAAMLGHAALATRASAARVAAELWRQLLPEVALPAVCALHTLAEHLRQRGGADAGAQGACADNSHWATCDVH